MSTLLIIFLMIFVLGPIAKAYADRISREIPPGSDINAAELARMKEEMDRLAAEVARLQEEQSFLVQLLGDGERKRLGQGPKGIDSGTGHDPQPPTGERHGDA